MILFKIIFAFYLLNFLLLIYYTKYSLFNCNMKRRSFYIETYGCTSNKADSLVISKILKDNGYYEVNFEEAEFIIINTCAVKQQTENKIKSRLKQLYSRYKNNNNKHFIIAGCLPHIDSNYIDVVKNLIPNFSAILDLDNFNELPAILDKISTGNRNLIIHKEHKVDKSEYLIDYPKGKITGILPISEGCLGSCTYCCVKNARGNLNCYDPENIVKNAEFQLKQGIKQLYLTSQDCSTYEYKSTKLVDLITSITNFNYEFFLRMGMLNPSFLIENYNQLSFIYTLKKVYQFLHIPLQSGSDTVLKKMNRHYKISDIKESLTTLRTKFPYLSISTDIICGFPEETENNFQETIDLITWLKPEILNISKFTIRPGTKARNMDQVESREIKERSIRLSKIFRASLININEKWNNWEGKVLILHKGSKVNQAFGRNFAYKNIFVENFKGNYGSFIDARVNKVDGFNLYAEQI
ncbi:MAG: tRNA (N(6)-L-threonylcarbamoyladenosine(37)-C(2))-methylthiotransferase [Candidatus Lokiarchaeota archaeon]|nr:tRNA (N(6)-L-threonylcarbamoyladenosine(37)-C(2))-methylthiotransferase [Candidatus Lokiarchaeota archaeon]